MKKSKKKATVKRVPKKSTITKAQRKEYNLMFDEHLRLLNTPKIQHVIGHKHNLPDGWKIVAATDPKLGPKYQDIEEFRELQNFYRNKPLSKIMAALGPDEKTKSLWEYAFIAGFYYAKNNNVTRNDPYIWFGEWARGFAHRLIVCADIAFKQGADHYLDRTNPINYVKEPKMKDKKRRLHNV